MVFLPLVGMVILSVFFSTQENMIPVPLDDKQVITFDLPKVEVKQKERKIKVAIIDTGVNFNHPLLAHFKSPLQKEEKIDKWHGTFVAGVLAKSLLLSIGHDSYKNVEFISYQVDDSYEIAQVIKALKQAKEDRIDVVNISLAGYVPSKEERDLILEMGKSKVTIIVSAGNDKTQEPAYPCSYTGVSNLICVTSLNEKKALSKFSNLNPQVKFGAYGEKVLSASGENEWAMSSGTSFATPRVTALKVLNLLEVNKKDFHKASHLLGLKQLKSYQTAKSK